MEDPLLMYTGEKIKMLTRGRDMKVIRYTDVSQMKRFKFSKGLSLIFPVFIYHPLLRMYSRIILEI